MRTGDTFRNVTRSVAGIMSVDAHSAQLQPSYFLSATVSV